MVSLVKNAQKGNIFLKITKRLAKPKEILYNELRHFDVYMI